MISPTIRRAITGALLVGTSLASLEVAVVGAIMPVVVGDLGGIGLYPWAFSAYLLTQTLCIPMFGLMADHYGRKPAYLAGVLLFLAGSVLCAMAGSMEALVVGRAVQGVGAASIVPLTMTIFGDLYPVEIRTRIQGLFSLVWGTATLIGPLLGAWLTGLWSWRAVFWFNLIPGPLASLLVALLLPTGFAKGQLGVAGSWRALLGSPTQQAVIGAGFLLGCVLQGVLSYLPVQIQGVDGGGPMEAGIALIPMSLAWTTGSNIAGRLVHRLGLPTMVRVGGTIIAVGATVTAIFGAHAADLIVLGFGMGTTIGCLTVSAQEAAPLGMRGTATSLSLFSRSIGSAACVPILGWLAGFRPGLTELSAIPDLDQGLNRIFLTLAVCAWAALLVVFVRYPRQRLH